MLRKIKIATSLKCDALRIAVVAKLCSRTFQAVLSCLLIIRIDTYRSYQRVKVKIECSNYEIRLDSIDRI